LNGLYSLLESQHIEAAQIDTSSAIDYGNYLKVSRGAAFDQLRIHQISKKGWAMNSKNRNDESVLMSQIDGDCNWDLAGGSGTDYFS
jgi:hypothetical protein